MVQTVVHRHIVMLDMERDVYLSLNEVGSRVWALIEEGHSGQAIVDILVDEYEIDRETLEKDVTDLVQKMIDKSIISLQSEIK